MKMIEGTWRGDEGRVRPFMSLANGGKHFKGCGKVENMLKNVLKKFYLIIFFIILVLFLIV